MTAEAHTHDGPPGIDVARLDDWLATALPQLGRVGEIGLLAGGRSNLTYRIGLVGGVKPSVVLRRPPLGHVLPTAHDMSREHRVLSALARGSDVPVPAPLALCTDESVIGAPFYVMDYVEGRILRTVEDGADVTPEQARQLSERLAETLAAIHTVDLDKTGLTDFGRPSGYLTRQLKRWGRQWDSSHAARLAASPHDDEGLTADYERLVARLTERLPAEERVGLVHGDFRLDNALTRLAPAPRIAAVVDWEMSTLGDPLADLGLTLVYWTEATDPDLLPVGSTITAAPGFLTRREFADRYAALSGAHLADLEYYMAFGCFKLAVVLEGIHARFLQHATVGEGFDEIGAGVPQLINRAHALLDA
jgi:aminoglycoside phosphotransferase (APT) family kinase protein